MLLEMSIFVVPCPKYILSPDTVISRVDTVLVQGQISLDQGKKPFTTTHWLFATAI